MTVKLTTLPELNRKAFAILSRELGVPETLRFFGQLGLGTGNYTEERRELFDGLTLDEYRKAVEETKAKTGGATEVP
jgi:hypothetical protein